MSNEAQQILQSLSEVAATIDQLQSNLDDEINDRKKLIGDAYANGASVAEIAKHAGISRQRIHVILNSMKGKP